LKDRTIATEFRDRRHREERKHRLNREIMAPEVRLSGVENEPLGVVSLMEALRMAGELDVDLVEIAATAIPPVCRLMDYGKFKYQEQKKAADAKSKQKVIEVKEVKFRPGTDDGDYNIKLRNIKRFLDDGDKCKITLRFRGREITHQEIGMALLTRMRADLADLIVVEQFPKLEGRQMIMMIAPGKKKSGSAATKVAAPSATASSVSAEAEV
jgi:translation initiation factor IF-3